MHLTEKQQKIFQFIKEYINQHNRSPSFEEIRVHFKFKSLATVSDYIQSLKERDFIHQRQKNKKRSIELIEYKQSVTTIPLIGTVAAGGPIDTYEIQDSIDVPENMLSGSDNVALIVKGDSMIESGIHDGDTIIVKRQETAKNGEIIIAFVDEQVTVKSYFLKDDKIELRPANSNMESIWVDENYNFRIYGVMVGLYRKF